MKRDGGVFFNEEMGGSKWKSRVREREIEREKDGDGRGTEWRVRRRGDAEDL